MTSLSSRPVIDASGHSGHSIAGFCREFRQITEVIDAACHPTWVEYDLLGRRTVINNLDTGKTELRYDLAGNLIAKVTANLREAGEGAAIRYAYAHNRLTAIYYPHNPQNNVSYQYGAPGASGNRAGRISQIQHAAGREDYAYGKLGERIYERKAIPVGPHIELYETRYAYDSFGRLQALSLPDGEHLDYSYDAGGQLTRIHGRKTARAAPHSVDHTYLARLEYDKFEQRVLMEQGNGVQTRYRYDTANRRLSQLQAQRPTGSPFQNLHYGYDAVGNMTCKDARMPRAQGCAGAALSLHNDVTPSRPNAFGGPVIQRFQYDDLYRLTQAEGRFDERANRSDHYSLTLQYDRIHRRSRTSLCFAA